MRFSANKEDSDTDINLTPLIDVVFLLLIFFMVTTNFSREAEIKLKLPEASSAEQVGDKDNSLTIQISDIGQYAVKGPEDENARELINTNEKSLKRALQLAAGDLQEPVIVIKADSLAAHQAVVKAMNAARMLGFYQITFVTEQPN